jgi:hypothetical protein
VCVKAVALSSAACTSPGVCSGADASLGAESGASTSLGAESGDVASLDPESPSGHSRLLSVFAQTHTVYARTHTQTRIPLLVTLSSIFFLLPSLLPGQLLTTAMPFRLQKDGIRLPDERRTPVQLHALRALPFFEREPELLHLQ